MAWEAISKAEVAKLSGTREADLSDTWYDQAVGLIETHKGIYNPGLSVTVTDVLDGDNTSRIRVRRPPIESVTSLYVDNYLISANSYVFSDGVISLIDNYSGNPYVFDKIFPAGKKNVTVTYVSGGGPLSVSGAVSLTIALIIKELANLHSQEGAESRLMSYRPGKSVATEDPIHEWGTHGKIKGIIEALLGVRMRAK